MNGDEIADWLDAASMSAIGFGGFIIVIGGILNRNFDLLTLGMVMFLGVKSIGSKP